MTRVPDGTGPRASRWLLAVTGLVLVGAAALYNEGLLGILAGGLPPATVRKIRLVELYLLSSGAGFLIVAEAVRRVPRLRRAAGRGWVANLLLVGLTVVVPLFVAELALRPFVILHLKTTLFVRDAELGWRLRPGVQDSWLGTVVKINAKGLRGPALDYAKPPGVRRILYLGDSVTFGFGLPDWRQTFPYLTGGLLEARTGNPVQTVNAGVGGYSPWQEYAFLEREGLRYRPDLIVVGFVLNDVTEWLELRRFGGTNEGFQLTNTYTSALDWLVNHSAVVAALRKIGARLRFGADVSRGAREKELLEVRRLVADPDGPEYERAWSTTLGNLEKIYRLGRDEHVPVLLVVFPFAFQLEDPAGSSGAQRIVMRHALDHGVPAIDLLPLLSTTMRERGTTPQDYFLDADHLSAHGSEVVAQVLAERIAREGWP